MDADAEYLGTRLPAPLPFSAELWAAPLAASRGVGAPLRSVPAAPAAAAPCWAGAASSRGAVPTAVLHPLGFGICDCSNDLLQ